MHAIVFLFENDKILVISARTYKICIFGLQYSTFRKLECRKGRINPERRCRWHFQWHFRLDAIVWRMHFEILQYVIRAASESSEHTEPVIRLARLTQYIKIILNRVIESIPNYLYVFNMPFYKTLHSRLVACTSISLLVSLLVPALTLF